MIFVYHVDIFLFGPPSVLFYIFLIFAGASSATFGAVIATRSIFIPAM